MQFFLQFAGFASSSFQLYKERPSTIKLVFCLFFTEGQSPFSAASKEYEG